MLRRGWIHLLLISPLSLVVGCGDDKNADHGATTAPDAAVQGAGDAGVDGTADGAVPPKPRSPCETGVDLRGAIPTGSPLGGPPPALDEFNGPYPSWKSIKAYGAVGDGTTDDTAAIQKGLDDLKAVMTNDWSVLYFPPGNYRITKTLATTRVVHNDYLGGDIVGDDPDTTSLVWDGAQDGTMLQLDAWYNKVSRLTFDGKGKAGTGLERSASFATYGELSDLSFKDCGTGILLGNGGGAGIAEQAVLRDRFYRTKYGVATWNYNTLDIYVWNSYFEDNTQALRNATGAYHAYQNVFVRSKETDLWASTNMQTTVVGNTSLGSKKFLGDVYASAHVQGNLVFSNDAMTFDFSSLHAATVLDNLVVATGAHEQSVVKPQGDVLMLGNVFVGTSPWPVQPQQQQFNHGLGWSYNQNHEIEKAIDGDPATYSTQMLYDTTPGGIRWNAPYGTQRTIAKYSVVANGYASTDYPADFGLYGSNDWGKSWDLLDSQVGVTWSAAEKKEFVVAKPAAYAMIDWRVQKTVGYKAGGQNALSVGELALIDDTGKNVLVDPAGLMTGSDESWGNFTSSEQLLLPEGQCGAAPASLEPWPFAHKETRKVFEVNAFTGEAIQAAIDLAAAEPVGSKPVVHLRKGAYTVATAIHVPPGIPISIVGDGGSEHGTIVSSSSSALGDAVVRLLGPSRATLRDMLIGSSTADGLVIENADQPGGRVYGNQLQCNGPGFPNMVAVSFDIDGIEQSDVTMTAFGMSNFLAGVRATGGAIRAAGQSAPGQVSFLTGATSAGNRNYDVKKNGELVVTGVWYEGDWAYQNPLIDLDANSSGSLTFAASLSAVVMKDFAIVRVKDFAGSLNLLNLWLDHRDTTHLDFSGNGQATRVFGFGNDYPMFSDPDKVTKTIDQLWVDTTAPAGVVSQIGTGTMPDLTNKKVGALADTQFVHDQLQPLRARRIERPNDRAAAVTDVKIFRVLVGAGANRTACAIRAH